MADMVNLRQARKARERARKRAESDANAAKHGISKVEKALQKARARKALDDHEAHRRDPGPEDGA